MNNDALFNLFATIAHPDKSPVEKLKAENDFFRDLYARVPTPQTPSDDDVDTDNSRPVNQGDEE
jgi:hypothetical protein